jgi:hypothetical protein
MARNRPQTISINGEMYYSAKKAEDILNMTYSGLRYQVTLGNIKAEVPKGRRQAYYKAVDVEQTARDLQSFSLQKKNKPTQFVRVKTIEEIVECMEISNALFGAERSDVNKHMRILGKNPETYYMIKDEDQAIGYTAIWPVKPGKLNDLLAQTIPVKISPEDIETFEKGKSIDLYINVIGIKPGFTKDEKRAYGARLVSGLIGVIVNLGKRGISIGTIGARSAMPDGIRLMKGIGFMEIEPLTPERRTFIIDVKQSGSPLAMEYKKALEEATKFASDLDSKEQPTNENNPGRNQRRKQPVIPVEQA